MRSLRSGSQPPVNQFQMTVETWMQLMRVILPCVLGRSVGNDVSGAASHSEDCGALSAGTILAIADTICPDRHGFPLTCASHSPWT